MRHTFLSRSRAGVAFVFGATIFLSGTASAAAQDTGAPQQGTSDLGASDPLVASQEGQSAEEEQTSQQAMGSEIVVTARRVSERAQDIPMSMTVATAEDLQNRSVLEFEDIQQQTPSLRITEAATSSSSSFISMRGQTATNFRLTTDTAAAVYIDEVYYPGGFGTAIMDFWDVARVEVLKGPQGTLFGRSTTGGLIHTITQAPVQRFEGAVRGRLGQHNTVGLAGMVNLPITETLAVRIAGEHHSNDGFGKNLANGRPLGVVNAESIRFSALWEPFDALSVTLRADYGRANDVARAYKGLEIVAPGTPVEGGGTAGASAAAAIATQLGISIGQAIAIGNSFAGGDKDDANLSTHPFDNTELYGGSLTASYEFNDAVTLRSISALRYFNRNGATDLDGTPFVLLEYNEMASDYEQFSQEIHLLGTAMTRLEYILGGYYSKLTGSDLYDQATIPIINPTSPLVQAGDVVNKSVGVFGHLMLDITDQIQGFGGLRWSKDDRELVSRNRNALFCLATGTPLATTGDCSAEFSASSSEWSYTVGVNYQPRRNLLLYAKHDRGYRAGGLPLAGGSAAGPAAAALSFAAVEPEITLNYEVGLKAAWFENRLRTNLAVFHSDYTDIQVSSSRPNPNGPGLIGVVENAGSATIRGVELEAVFFPTPDLELGGTLTYTDAFYGEFSPGPGLDYSHLPLLLTPEWQYSLRAAYSKELPGGTARAQVDWIWEDETLASYPAGTREAFGLLNGRLSFNFDRQDAEIAIFGKNLTNTRYLPFPLDAQLGLGFTYHGYYNNPRTIGLEVSKRF